MQLEKVSNRTLRQQIYDQLHEKIVSAEILPGQVLPLRKIGYEMGVSLIPVREALFQLESEKVVVLNSKGFQVNKLTAEEMTEALRIRLVLESMAAERACRLRPNSAVQEVKELLDGMAKSLNNQKRFVSLNSQFHRKIYSYAQSPMLLQIIGLIWARIAPYSLIFSSEGGDVHHAQKCHENIYKALARKDKKMITKFLRADIESAVKLVITILRSSERPH
jgi:DNA-binding GntR family transcriptional regulator